MSVKNPPESDASGFFVVAVDCLVRAVDGNLVVTAVVFKAAVTFVVFPVVTSFPGLVPEWGQFG